jgi:regulator of chromosome condensation
LGHVPSESPLFKYGSKANDI